MILTMKRSSVTLWLAVGFTLCGIGFSLQCHNCTGGSTEACKDVQECPRFKDTCIKLQSSGKTYTNCVVYSDCDFMILAVKFESFDFTYNCCQSDLCNGEESPGLFQKFKTFIKSLF